MTITHATDEELGRVRYCRTCAEWWPDDGEFWEPGARVCIACTTETLERRRDGQREASRRYRRQAVYG